MLANIETLMRGVLVINSPEREIRTINYRLAGHGVDDQVLLGRLAKLYEHATPALMFENPGLSGALAPLEDGRIRIGVVAHKLRSETYNTLLFTLLKSLDKEKFSLVVFTSPDHPDERLGFVQEQADHAIRLPRDLPTAREAIAQQKAAVLIFTDIGRDALTYFLGFARLAPVQCVAWDFPVSSSLRNIDYFLSCDAFEPPGAEAQYSEDLIRLAGIPVIAGLPSFNGTANGSTNGSTSADRFGLEDGSNLYLCTSEPESLHPDFDRIIGGILRNDVHGLVILAKPLYQSWSDSLLNRMRVSISDVIDRVRFVSLDKIESRNELVTMANVFLDPPHFSNLSGTYQSISTGTPVVTMEGQLHRSRQCAGVLRYLGHPELVTDSIEAYVGTAVALGTDKARRESLGRELRESALGLYTDNSLIESLQAFLFEAVEKSRSDI